MKFVTVGRLNRVELRRHAKFGRNQSKRGRDMAIFRFLGDGSPYMLSDSCLSVPSCPVLSVTLVHCGQTVGRVKMKLGMQVGLGPGHTVLDGDPAPPPHRGAEPRPNF